ncbi:MAG: hypothetical protein G01um101438_916 [Parcubacteria group bacterium Gr01-1014_38]|nr:MAG: hypothetical protein G01um101438_916 [Parcubacteria group bacterium Gr01-1014_38]
MNITEIRVKLVAMKNNERIHAFCSITFDGVFVVRDLKIVEGTKGLLVAMPSRKLTNRCPKCGCKNHRRARYGNQCGDTLILSVSGDTGHREKLHADIAHPISAMFRELVESAVLAAYQEECERSKQPGYVCTYDAHVEGQRAQHGHPYTAFGAGILE